MYLQIFLGCLFSGIILSIIDYLIPWQILGAWFFYMYMPLRVMGICLIAIGAIVLIIRIFQTTTNVIIEPSGAKRVVLIHRRRGGRGKFMRGRLGDLEHIFAKNKVFKDTGGGFRLGGHDFKFTQETVSHDIPEWASDWVHTIKLKYGVNDLIELRGLYNNLKKITTIHDVLKISELRELLKNPDKRKAILDTSLDDIKHLAEMVYDGTSINMDDYERFQESAAPNDLDTLMGQNFVHRELQFRHYNPAGSVNWATLAITFTIIIVGGALAFLMITGAL